MIIEGFENCHNKSVSVTRNFYKFNVRIIIKMDTRPRTSPGQFAVLLEFMETHGDLARPQKGVQGRVKADLLWENLSNLLNSVGGGVCREKEKWKKIWADWKTKTKKKAAFQRKNINCTGNGQSSSRLTRTECRILDIMGVSAVVGLSVVEERGFDAPPLSTQDNITSEATLDPEELSPVEMPPPPPPAYADSTALASAEATSASREKDVTHQHNAQRQISLEEIFLVENEWDSNNAESKQIDKLIGEMIALQTLPFNFVEGVGFRRLIKALAPAYNFRGQRFFTDFVCEELYGRVAAKVKQLIQKFNYMSFSYDVRSDLSSNYTLLIFTCYGITENFERSSATLKCEIIFEDRRIDDTIAEKIDGILSEWNIKVEQVHSITWKKGWLDIKNEIGAINDIDCIVHKIQLCIRSCLHSQENIKCVKQKCKEIAAHFNDSTIAQKQLEIIQDKMNQPHHKVCQDGITRWNSTYYMFERFLKVKDALSFYFNESDIEPIVHNDWKIIESCVMLLKPYEEVTRELSSSHALISSVIPMIQALQKNVEEYLTGPHDCDPLRLAANTLKTELCLKFSNLLQDNKFLIATYLDPRYKHKLFTAVTQKKIKEDILKMVNTEYRMLSSPNYWRAKRKRMRGSSENSIELAGMSGTITKPSLLDHLTLILESSSEDESQQTSNSTDSAFKKELLTYRNKKRINLDENPLTWWRVHCQNFKILSPLARRFLSPSAASFQSEQLFSSSDLINNPHLNRVDTEEAAILLFIKYNTPILD